MCDIFRSPVLLSMKKKFMSTISVCIEKSW